MARNKTPLMKRILSVANRTRKRAPVWVFAKTNRKVRNSPKSGRHWRRDNIF
ncbi:MAG: 50S ribosomal protein L39e [Methanobacteriota archaeon]